MNGQLGSGVSGPTIPRPAQARVRAAVHAAESVCNLPAVPTQDWCDRAARSLLALRQPCFVLVMFARLRAEGAITQLECVGVAGCSVAEVATTLGRNQTFNSVIALNATHPVMGRLRSGSHTASELGWTPSAIRGANPALTHTGTLELDALPETSPVRARWGESGVAGLAVGAVPLTGEEGRTLIVELGAAGGADHLAQANEDADLLAAVLPPLSRRAALAFNGAPYSEATCLTHREEQVLEHLLIGRSVRQIAEELGRSPHTVHDHVKSLHRKLNASSRGALVARALGYSRPQGAKA